MNELLQKHGCSNVFSIPEGLKELMADISREVLRDQPPKIYDYIANYLSVLLITREHGILAVKILDDLCDCRPSVSEHLIQLGMENGTASMLSGIIKEEVEKVEPIEGSEKVKETQILKKILTRVPLDEEMSANVCQVARNAYRDYWYRKKLIQKELNVGEDDEAWEIAASRTLELYKRTKPSFTELARATEKIQAAYRGYYVRRKLLRHLKPQKPKGPKVTLPGPPLDIAGSRNINLGPVINLPAVRTENTAAEFDDVLGESLHLGYDPTKTITHEPRMVDETPSACDRVFKNKFGLASYIRAHKRRSLSSKPMRMTITAQVSVYSREFHFRDADAAAKSGVISEAGLGKPSLKNVAGEEPLVPLEDNTEIPLDDEPMAGKRSRFFEGGEEDKTPGAQISFAAKHDEKLIKDLDDQTRKASEVTDTDVPEELTSGLTSDEGQEDTTEVPEEITTSGFEVTDSAGEAEDSTVVPDDSTAVPDDSAGEATDSANVSAPVTDAEVTTEEEEE